MSKIHIGKKIKEVLDKTALTVVDFSQSIGLTRNGVYKIFEKETIDTGQLQKIGHVLNHDFFNYYSSSPLNITNESKPDYGYATKEELSELSLTLLKLTRAVEKLQEELPKKKAPQKRKSSKAK